MIEDDETEDIAEDETPSQEKIDEIIGTAKRLFADNTASERGFVLVGNHDIAKDDFNMAGYFHRMNRPQIAKALAEYIKNTNTEHLVVQFLIEDVVASITKERDQEPLLKKLLKH